MDKATIESIIAKAVAVAVAEALKAATESATESAPKAAKAVKAAKAKAVNVVKPQADFNLVKSYVLARKAGTLKAGPFVACYRHFHESTTLESVKASSATALDTLHKDAEKLRAAGVKF